MNHPYRQAPNRSFWNRAVATNYDPKAFLEGEPMIGVGEKVVSAGSCFAANLVPYLEAAGFTYVRTEPPHPAFGTTTAENFGYARFSASYGNLYTARQLLQLLRRATRQFQPVEDRWYADGEIHDPFRPALRYPARTDAEFDLLTAQHLRKTLEAFCAADVFIFTLGLTEAWISKLDGAVYPACPGTIKGTFDPDRHAFHNFTVDEIVGDLRSFISELRDLNPRIRFILTVSPVPLVATATGEHVMPATVYSKSVLRVAAEAVRNSIEGVRYFPAYEIITGPAAPYEFFEADRRSVAKSGVDTVMGAFLAHCAAGNGSSPVPLKKEPVQVAQRLALIEAECEEEMMNR